MKRNKKGTGSENEEETAKETETTAPTTSIDDNLGSPKKCDSASASMGAALAKWRTALYGTLAVPLHLGCYRS
jgi:hypothetical protein